jgi:hypothetical protein
MHSHAEPDSPAQCPGWLEDKIRKAWDDIFHLPPAKRIEEKTDILEMLQKEPELFSDKI